MGLDYRYLLFFEREARFEVLERLAEMAVPGMGGPTTLVLADRTVTLPFGAWMQTDSSISWDDPAGSWEFMTVLCFEPDPAIEAYLDDPAQRDDQGRATVGYVYLTVHLDMGEWPSETGDDLVLFEFGTPGSTMSVLFFDSASIRRSFVDLLESCRGVYGLFDMEDGGADLFWLRGRERDDRLPTSDLPLADIERFIGGAGPTSTGTGDRPA